MAASSRRCTRCTPSRCGTGRSWPRPATRGFLTFLRSSAKPLQALPLARTRPDIDDRELAIACASHRALPEQLVAVRALLADAPATEGDLESGGEPSPRERTAPESTRGF